MWKRQPPSDTAKALADRIAKTRPSDWLFEGAHCHYAPGGRSAYSSQGISFTYFPMMLYQGPQDFQMREANRAQMPNGRADLLHVKRAIQGVHAARMVEQKAEREARKEALRIAAANNAQAILREFPAAYLKD